jgi:hypothetical protein
VSLKVRRGDINRARRVRPVGMGLGRDWITYATGFTWQPSTTKLLGEGGGKNNPQINHQINK